MAGTIRLSLPRLLNCLKNTRSIGSALRASVLKGLARGAPAIVLGAGPSATRAIDAFKGLRGKAVFLVVDSIYPEFVRRAGFEPDFVATIDPQAVILLKFQGHFGDTRLLHHPSALSDVVERFERRVVWDAGGCAVSYWLGRGNWPLPMTSCTHLALYMAAILKCDPIVLGGFELGTWAGEPTHAEGVRLSARSPAQEGEARSFQTNRAFVQMGGIVERFQAGFRPPLVNVTPEGLPLRGVSRETMLEMAMRLARRPLFRLRTPGLEGKPVDRSGLIERLRLARGVARERGPFLDCLGPDAPLFKESFAHLTLMSQLGAHRKDAIVFGESMTILRLAAEALEDLGEPMTAGERRLRAVALGRRTVENGQYLTSLQDRVMQALGDWKD